MILAAVGCLASYVVAWAGMGFPVSGLWWASLVAPAAGALGMVLRRRGWLTAGFYLLVGLAAVAAVRGAVAAGLGATALAVWGWDMGLLTLARLDLGEPERTRRLARAATFRSASLALAGLAVSVGFTVLRIEIPFWGLVGGSAAAWAAVVLLLRALRKAYGWGGDASGKRSASSRPTR